jgi:hypothetical protein
MQIAPGGTPMSTENKKDVWVDGNLFNENVSKIPFEEISKYAGKYVAYTLDGTRIVMADDDEAELCDRLEAAGIDISQVVFSYVQPLDVDSIL